MVDLSMTGMDRTFSEEVDWVEAIGGTEFFETGLATNFTKGLCETDPHAKVREEIFLNNIPVKKRLASFCEHCCRANHF